MAGVVPGAAGNAHKTGSKGGNLPQYRLTARHYAGRWQAVVEMAGRRWGVLDVNGIAGAVK
jgi:hypothetical protein